MFVHVSCDQFSVEVSSFAWLLISEILSVHLIFIRSVVKDMEV